MHPRRRSIFRNNNTGSVARSIGQASTENKQRRTFSWMRAPSFSDCCPRLGQIILRTVPDTTCRTGTGTQALARQRKLQIMGYFAAQSLYSHSLKSNSEDYRLDESTLTCLPSFFVRLQCPELTVRMHILFHSSFDVSQWTKAPCTAHCSLSRCCFSMRSHFWT